MNKEDMKLANPLFSAYNVSRLFANFMNNN